MMQIKLYIGIHNNKERLFARFSYNADLNKIIRSVKGAKWSQSKKQWHFDVNKETVALIKQRIKNVAEIDTTVLKQQLSKKKQVVSIKTNSSIKSIQPVSHLNKQTLTAFHINDKNLRQLGVMIKTLQLKAYSQNTIALYRSEVLYLMRLLGERSIEILTQNQIKSYLLWLLQAKNYSEAKVHTAINALKFYFEQVL
jgi:hypothetical protein